MPTEELEVIISPDGEVSIQARGFVGTGCLSATADLEKSLGGQVVERAMIAEASQPAETAEEQRLRDGGRRSW